MMPTKKWIRYGISQLIRISKNNRVGVYLLNQVLNSAMEQQESVKHRGITLRFATPNQLCQWRSETFATKEPETLDWIEKINEGSILWDIGANIGLYSVYAAKKQRCRVFSFEPSVFNLELLARNVYINKLTERITIIPLPLSDKLGPSQMRLTTTQWGGALSSFDRSIGWDGNKIDEVFNFPTLGLSMNDAVAFMGVPQPDYIKMDVDGLEHFILQGGIKVLSQIKGILIEVNDSFEEQSRMCEQLLKEAGLALKDKTHSELIRNSNNGFNKCYNQIWSRP